MSLSGSTENLPRRITRTLGRCVEKAIRKGWIQRTGDVRPAGGRYKPNARKHGHSYPVYQNLIYKDRRAA